ncbi:hypothetical protein [Anabaena sp. UHCC 0204]|nr:hypothetical protein [Anabaena sp. UHCC 0204]
MIDFAIALPTLTPRKAIALSFELISASDRNLVFSLFQSSSVVVEEVLEV